MIRSVVLAVSLAVIVAPGFAQVAGKPQPLPVPEDKQVAAIQTVLINVREALIRVQKTLRGKKYPPLATVTLTLQTTVSKEVGGQLKLWVITIGKKLEKEKSQEVVIRLTPPTGLEPTNVGAESLTAALESAIVSAAEGAQNAGSADLPLDFSGLAASISFTVKNTGTAGANVEISPITADFSGSLANTAVQNLKVTFGKIE